MSALTEAIRSRATSAARNSEGNIEEERGRVAQETCGVNEVLAGLSMKAKLHRQRQWQLVPMRKRKQVNGDRKAAKAS